MVFGCTIGTLLSHRVNYLESCIFHDSMQLLHSVFLLSHFFLSTTFAQLSLLCKNTVSSFLDSPHTHTATKILSAIYMSLLISKLVLPCYLALFL